MIYKDVIENREVVCVDNDGFLEGQDYQSIIGIKYSSEFEVVRDINQYMYEIYDAIKVNKEDEVGKLIIGSYNKIHKSYQAAILCCSRGLEEQAKILIRTILDKSMIATAVMRNPDNYNKWIEMQLFEKNRLITNIRDKKPGLEDFSLEESVQKSEKGRRISQKNWADMAGMTADYYYIYTLFSGEVHLSASSIEWDFGLDSDDSYMNLSPRTEETDVILLTLADYVMRFVEQLIAYFDIRNTRFGEIYTNLKMRQEEYKEREENRRK